MPKRKKPARSLSPIYDAVMREDGGHLRAGQGQAS